MLSAIKMPSKLEQLQQQYRRQLLQEKEERLIKIHTDSQQKALSKVSRHNGYPPPPPSFAPPSSLPHHSSPVKKGSPGVDRSRPLPPLPKERTLSSTRASPVSAPSTDSTTSRVPSANSRSKSVDLIDCRQSLPKSTANGSRNGIARPAVVEPTKSPSPPAETHRRGLVDSDTLSKLKQAELQRLRTKTREESFTRSTAQTATISKSSIVQKKPPSRTQPPPASAPAPPARIKSRVQVANTARRPVAPSKPAPRGTAPPQTTVRRPPGPGQEQCRVCGRNFNSDRIQKHASVCEKSAKKKVKVFDATKMRVKGTEAEQFVRKGLPKEEPKPKKSDWRKKHSDFIEAIRQAKMVQQHLAKGGKVSDLPPPPPSDTSDYVPCPHCGRKFSEAVAERHIPKCKNILSNKKNPHPQKRR